MNDLDWQIAKVEYESGEWLATLYGASDPDAMHYRAQAGEWMAVQNSLIELRNRRAGDEAAN
jgi:hypothetical protein